MTISTTTRRKNQTSDGVQTSFVYDFLVLDTDHIEVYLDGDEDSPLTGYIVTGIGDEAGGTVDFSVAPAAGILTVARKVPRIQTYDYITRGKFPSDTHERLADLLVMMVQEIEDKIDRSILLPISTDTSELSLPEPEADKALVWNSLADGLTNLNLESINALAVSDFAKTLIDDTDADAFWATLMASITKATARTSLGVDSQTDNNATITPGSDGDVTLTAAQNAATIRILETGSWASGHSLVCDDVDREFIIINNSGYTSTVTTSGTTPTTEDVSTGQSRYLITRQGVGVEDPLSAYYQKSEITQPGNIINVWSDKTTAVATTTTQVGYDDSIPPITEGGQFSSVTLTPSDPTSKLIFLLDYAVESSAGAYIVIALFDGSTDAIAASAMNTTGSGGIQQKLSLQHIEETAGSGSRTYTVRIGPAAGTTVTVNGVSGSRKLGGVLESGITILEVKS